MTPVLGGEVTERLLLESYLQLCTDSVFHVRKVSARKLDLGSLITDMCVIFDI